ncbi:hypothetical protein ARTHRO9AX_220310 [Arthrobacter sp. 9AX]|nr:hypothetical protein ARTHRO9AX_220310 [Arthrobacter sp. 9AX]
MHPLKNGGWEFASDRVLSPRIEKGPPEEMSSLAENQVMRIQCGALYGWLGHVCLDSQYMALTGSLPGRAKCAGDS